MSRRDWTPPTRDEPPAPPPGTPGPLLADGPLVALPATELGPEQECRARSLDSAARLLAPTLDAMNLTAVAANLDEIVRVWVTLAYHGDAWISDGHVPS